MTTVFQNIVTHLPLLNLYRISSNNKQTINDSLFNIFLIIIT